VEVSVSRLRGTQFYLLLGYSFLTSQYGLAVDNVAGYELILPNRTIKDVTLKDHDLWFGLRVSSHYASLIQISIA
jgi:hypothetical protein